MFVNQFENLFQVEYAPINPEYLRLSCNLLCRNCGGTLPHPNVWFDFLEDFEEDPILQDMEQEESCIQMKDAEGPVSGQFYWKAPYDFDSNCWEGNSNECSLQRGENSETLRETMDTTGDTLDLFDSDDVCSISIFSSNYSGSQMQQTTSSDAVDDTKDVEMTDVMRTNIENIEREKNIIDSITHGNEMDDRHLPKSNDSVYACYDFSPSKEATLSSPNPCEDNFRELAQCVHKFKKRRKRSKNTKLIDAETERLTDAGFKEIMKGLVYSIIETSQEHSYYGGAFNKLVIEIFGSGDLHDARIGKLGKDMRELVESLLEEFGKGKKSDVKNLKKVLKDVLNPGEKMKEKEKVFYVLTKSK
jgi:hypothetical protein